MSDSTTASDGRGLIDYAKRQVAGAERSGPGALPLAIGPYRISSILGQGGTGVVYLAEQTEPIRRQVALKLIKLGMDTQQVIARFESERQALAVGTSITRYCNDHTLDTTQRLRLFMQVCNAVQHAHQKGIIHRDIKPSNVLVSEQGGPAFPKIIDFGVAKAIEHHLTQTPYEPAGPRHGPVGG